MDSCHRTDSDGNPAGGLTTGVGYRIDWQDGPLGRDEERQDPNGAFVEEIIKAAIDRLEFYQRSKFACSANHQAIEALQTALTSLQNRTANREARGVEGTHTK